MLLAKDLIKNIQLNLAVLNIYGPYPYQITKKSAKLTFHTENNLKRENLKIICLLFLTILMVYQVFQYKNGFKNPVLYEVVLYISCQIVFISIVRTYFQRHKDVVELFNTLIQFERDFLKGIV